jgi:hypothetical protein
MKTSDLIKKLESLKEKHGDNELRFTVKDHYSIYGEEMTTGLKCGENTNTPSDWSSVFSNGSGCTTIEFSLSESREGKYPKITFRK